MSDQELWNEQEVLNDFDGDEDILMETCEMFLELNKEHIQKLRDKLAEGNIQGAGEEAHSIKGMVGYFNKGVVMAAAKRIEDKARQGEYSSNDELEVDINSLAELIEKLCVHIKDFLDRHK